MDNNADQKKNELGLKIDDQLTTKEYEVDSAGNRILKKVIYVSKPKFEYADFILRVVGGFAFILAIIQLGYNYKAQKDQIKFQMDQQKVLFQSNVYEESLPTINILCSKVPHDSMYLSSKNEFHFEVIPKIRLTNNPKVIKYVNQLDSILILRESLSGLADSYYHNFLVLDEIESDFTTAYSNDKYHVVNSIVENNFDRYWLFFNSQRRDWTNGQDYFTERLKICFGMDAALKYYQSIKDFYDKIYRLNSAYMDVCIFNYEKLDRYDISSQGRFSKQKIYEIVKAHEPYVYGDSLKIVVKEVHKIDSLIQPKMRDIQERILNSMVESNNIMQQNNKKDSAAVQ